MMVGTAASWPANSSEGSYYSVGFYDIEFENCFQFTLRSSYLTQLCINRWFYQAVALFTGDMDALAYDWWAEWAQPLADMQSDEFLYLELRALALFGDRQQGAYAISGGHGSLSGAELPAFFGSRVRLYPSDTRVRKGRKIYAGIIEDQVDGNTLNAGYADENAILLAKHSEIIHLAGLDFNPVLLSPANTRHTGDVIAAVTQALWAGWSTQSSRKIGRGA